MSEQRHLMIFRRGELVCDMRIPEGYLHRESDFPSDLLDHATRQRVGSYKGFSVDAVHTLAEAELDPMAFAPNNLYRVLPSLQGEARALVSRGAHLAHWRHTHRFCGVCGGGNIMHPSEPGLQCDRCGHTTYPRVSPCGITLVVDGDRVLLARNARFPRPMYSTLAGFVEAGESAEETVVREVKEEVGVDVGQVVYFDSQSWPFPDQLMLGYFAQYQGGEIEVDGDEIAEARWFDYRDLPPNIPPTMSIAGRLIEHYCQLRSLGMSLF